MAGDAMSDYRDRTFIAVVIMALIIGLLPGCAYLPRCEVIYIKSVVVQDAGKARDISSETGAPLDDVDVKLGKKKP